MRGRRLFRRVLPPLTLTLSPLAGRGNGERLVDEFRDGQAVGQFQSLLERIRETRTEIFPDDDPVDDDVDVMLEFFVELRRIANVVYCTVDLEALVPLLLPLGDFLAVLAFAAAHDGRQDQKTRALWQRKHTIDHLRNGLAFDRQAGRRRIGNTDAGEQQTQVVVDFRHRADGRARVLARRLLLDRDCRRQPVDVIDVRLLHHLEELARVCRQALDVAALALGVDRVEG